MYNPLKSLVLSHFRKHARKALEKHKPTVIGIAGSVGKTSTRNAIESILKDHFKTKSIGNSETGIPLGILGLKPIDYTKKDWWRMIRVAPKRIDHLEGTKYLIAEMGIDDPYPPKNMEYLLTIVKPDIAISLNVSGTHMMQFEKALSSGEKKLPPYLKMQILLQKISLEDTKIITESNCRVGIYNADDNLINTIMMHFNRTREDVVASDAENHNKKTPLDDHHDKSILLSFGSKGNNAISFGIYKVGLKGTSYQMFIKQKDVTTPFTLQFGGLILPKEYQEVFAAAILACLQTGLTLEQITLSLVKNFTLPKGRATILEGINNSVIIDSSYNASKAAVFAFLELVNTLKKTTQRPVVFLFGDMRELGNEAKFEHEEVTRKLIGIVDYLYLVGPLTREHVLPFVEQHDDSFKETRWFIDAKHAGQFMEDDLPDDAIVLVKGSQNTIFLEEAIKFILKNKEDVNKLCRQDEYWMRVKSQ